MSKSGLADSPFFQPPATVTDSSPKQVLYTSHPKSESKKSESLNQNIPKSVSKKNELTAKTQSNLDTVIPRHHDTVTPRNHATTVSSNHATMQPDNRDAITPQETESIIEIVRRAARDLGKEAATHRFTVQEKKSLYDLTYSYKGQGIKTSENEIARISINYILEDYRRNGENSILDKVLKALNQ